MADVERVEIAAGEEPVVSDELAPLDVAAAAKAAPVEDPAAVDAPAPPQPPQLLEPVAKAAVGNVFEEPTAVDNVLEEQAAAQVENPANPAEDHIDAMAGPRSKDPSRWERHRQAWEQAERVCESVPDGARHRCVKAVADILMAAGRLKGVGGTQDRPEAAHHQSLLAVRPAVLMIVGCDHVIMHHGRNLHN